MVYPYMDWTMLIVLPGLLLAMLAQFKVSGAFRKYAQVRSRSGLTGAEVARRMLDRAGLGSTRVELVRGRLTDHYDPREQVLRLSDEVYASSSIAALGVAAHECGHALQHGEGYAPLGLRSAIVPVVGIGSNLSWPLFLLGLVFSWDPLILAGIALFALTVVFTLVTLPVEFNASSRALAALEGGGYLDGEELVGARKVLNAAALTYVASALSAILQLVRLLVLSGNRRSRD
ncbi:zinc metallopeptidase [Bacillota bacterium Meth-B3]|nr:zinc metallopeptidase [Christensenellaceae bacterium]MEA5066223.1 zinc metallopeptidase [Eubacteriales bacterium]MEA5068798.1 zinc metallopeptidase [Christensenellaceae bacterium]